MILQRSILFILFFSIQIFSQVNWKTLSNMSSVRSAAASSDGIWSATSGGAFFYNLFDHSYKSFSKSDGLSGISLTAAAVDKYGKIWFGSANGIIDIYDPASNSFRSVLDIFSSDKISKQINDIVAEGDTIFVSTDFGISLLNATSLIFYDTYFRLGNFSSNIKINSILKTNLIYAATDFGVAVQKQGASNLSAPDSWNVFTTNEGLLSNKINRIIIYDGNVIAATDKGLAVFNGVSWLSFLPAFNNHNIIDVATDGESLFFITPGNVYSFNSGSINQHYQTILNLIQVNYSSQSGLVVSSSAGLLKFNSDFTNEIIVPNGPQVNQFPELSVDKNGTLWSSSGRDQTGAGFYKYENGIWTNYNIASYPQLPSNFYFTVFTAPDNSKYLGNWGFGFVRIKDDNLNVFTHANTGMQGTANDPNFLVVSHFAADSKNNLWILNFEPADKKSLSMLTPDSSWYHFQIPSENDLVINQHYYLAVDQYDTKWFSSLDPKRRGLFYFNESKTFDNSTDDRSGYINSSNGLNENEVNAIIVDRRGDIWVGTSLGVNVISNNNSIVSQANPQLRISSVFALRQQTINCIAVDPLNQKWVGTNQGLLHVNSDGSSLIASYDSKNSPLLADVIRSLAIDENTGRIYVGTDVGITSFETPSIKPEESFNELFIYPSPCILNGSNKIITIDGLIRDTDIKILSSSGKLVNQFASPGGRTASWNGRDLDGNLVNSGVYFIVAFDKEGNNVSTGKVAVLKE